MFDLEPHVVIDEVESNDNRNNLNEEVNLGAESNRKTKKISESFALKSLKNGYRVKTSIFQY